MKVVNALVTSIGGAVGQGILKGLKEMSNVHIIGADRRYMTAGNFYCDKVYKIPRFTEVEKYIHNLKEIIEEEQIDVFFPGHPMETELYNVYREQLDIPIGLPESPVYDKLLDKETAYLYMEEMGLSDYVPTYYGFTDNEDLIRIKQDYFPNDSHVIVKDVRGYGALGFAYVTNRENFLKAMKEGRRRVTSIDDYLAVTENTRRIAMETLKKPEYSVDVFMHNKEVVVAVPRKRTGVSNGLVLDGIIEKQEELLEATERIAGQLVTNGFFNMQFMGSEDGYKLTDINPRFGGSQVMSIGAGVNFPQLFVEYFLFGNRPKPEPAWGMRMLRYRDTFFIKPEDNIPEVVEDETIEENKQYLT